jgi:hypothetical protein
MACTTNPEDRAALVAGLRELAGFLAAHPDAPISPGYCTEAITVFPDGDTYEERRAGVDQAAAVLGIPAADVSGTGHYMVSRRFGPVAYEVLAISAAARARHDADASYYGCVQPGSLGEVA